jgi:hypothetical protein
MELLGPKELHSHGYHIKDLISDDLLENPANESH